MAKSKPNKNLILKNRIKYLEEENDKYFSRVQKAEKEVELKEEIIEHLKDFDKRGISERERFLDKELDRLQDIIRWFIKPSSADIKTPKNCNNCGAPHHKIR